MITPSRAPAQPDSWQAELARAITDPARLLAALGLPGHLLPAARAAAARFPLRVTRHYLGLIRPGDPDDPLLRQVLPLGEELRETPGFGADPVGDHAAGLMPGLLQKYHGRALLVATGACGIHCRYCFRRNFPYAEASATRHWEELRGRLADMPDIEELILSGGDPLSLSDARLARMLADLEALPRLRRLRIHSRLPGVLPARLTPALERLLAGCRPRVSLVLHCNHARELSEPLRAPLERLRRAGITLLNQSVLLRGVNDSADALCALSERLFDYGILPYYLHALDRVAGAAHFALPDSTALSLHREMQARLPGYLVPRLVREIPGQPSKTLLESTIS